MYIGSSDHVTMSKIRIADTTTLGVRMSIEAT